MAQGISRPAILPLTDDVGVKEVFAEACVGLSVLNGNVHVTFASVIANHSEERAPSRRVVSARVVMPVAGAADLRDLLAQLLDALDAQATGATLASPPTVVTPLKRPT
jgi:hypothetical protein